MTTTVPFAEALKDVSAGNTKIPQAEFHSDGDLAVVDQGQSLVAGYTENRSAEVRAPAPVIVFGDHTRAVKFIDFPFAMGADGVKVLQVLDGFDPKFVYHYLRFQQIPGAGYSRHFKFLKQVNIPKPPLPEQRRIAAILDHADALRAKRRQVRAHLDALTQSIFHDMFGATHDGQRIELGQLATVITKGTTPTTVGLNFTETGVPFLRAQNLQRGTVAFGGNDLHISEDTHKTLKRSWIEPRDLLISIAGTIGRVALVPSKSSVMNCNQAVAIVRLSDPQIGPWLLSWLNSKDARAQIGASAVTATISNLSLGQIRKLRVPSVSHHAIDAFGARTVAVAARQATLAAAMSVDDELFASLQSRAFRGEL